MAAVSGLDFAAAFPFGQTVTLVMRSVTGQDGDGNDIYTLTPTPIENVPVWPTGSTELIQGQDTVTTHMTCLLPVTVDPISIDAVTIGNDTYEVDGAPQPYTNPFTGLTIGTEINLTRVEG